MFLVRVIAIVRGKVVSERSVYITRDIFQHSWISGDSIRTIYSRRRIKAQLYKCRTRNVLERG